ncbi:MAG TPA: ComEC/Rec2 family competence protein [Bacteroidales bacterium]|nr:ComEC/Rec2 family competence protein [Bacteroidales bacterium]
MLHREIPFLRICVIICAGIISGLFIKPGAHLLLLIAFTVILLFIFTIRASVFKIDYLFGAFFNISLFTCGLYMYTSWKESITTLKEEPGLFRCVVSDYPEAKQSSVIMRMKLMYKYEGTIARHVKGSIVVYHEKEQGSSYLPGDILTINLTPQPITNRGNPYEFDYKFYMENLGIRYSAFSGRKDIKQHVKPQRRSIKYKALIIRQKILQMYSSRGVTAERLPLVAAITLGEKSLIERDIKDKFIRAGIMHIMAVSGLHAVILSMFIFKIFFFLNGRYNLLRIILTLLLLWCFAYVTGLTPSVLRATLMYSFLQAGNIMHRRVNNINSVLASAFVLIIIRPPVIFDAGFLLSYSAVIFIIIFYNKMNSILKTGNIVVSWLWQSVSITTVAQAGTLALTIMLFNRFPPYFLLTNMIIVPLSSLIVILGCILPVFYKLELISGFIGKIIDKLTLLTEWLTESAGKLPYSSIEDIGMTLPETIFLSAFVFTIMMFLFSEKRKRLLPALAFALLYLSSSTIKEITVGGTSEFIVYNTPGSINLGIRTGESLTVYSDTSILNNDIRKHCVTLKLKAHVEKVESNVLLRTNGTNILLCIDVTVNQDISSKADFIVFNDRLKTGNLKNVKESCILISTGRVRMYNNRSNVYYTRKSGAYIKVF